MGGWGGLAVGSIMGWREIRKREGFFLFSTGGEAKEDRNRISASLPALAHARHKFLFYESYSYSRVASSDAFFKIKHDLVNK